MRHHGLEDCLDFNTSKMLAQRDEAHAFWSEINQLAKAAYIMMWRVIRREGMLHEEATFGKIISEDEELRKCVCKEGEHHPLFESGDFAVSITARAGYAVCAVRWGASKILTIMSAYFMHVHDMFEIESGLEGVQLVNDLFAETRLILSKLKMTHAWDEESGDVVDLIASIRQELLCIEEVNSGNTEARAKMLWDLLGPVEELFSCFVRSREREKNEEPITEENEEWEWKEMCGPIDYE